MKTVNKFLVVLVAATVTVSSTAVLGQNPASPASGTRQRLVAKTPATEGMDAPVVAVGATKSATKKDLSAAAVTQESAAPADRDGQNLEDVLLAGPDEKTGDEKVVVTTAKPSDIPDDTQANRHEQVSEEAAVVPYYNNFFNTYRLGPEDVVSVSVFGQDRYSRSGIIIPPSGRISLALIPGGIFVNGKTVDEVADSIKKRYDEYIIDPQVSVSLDKASSYRYSVIGDVAQPGIRLMSHRMTVTEALAEAGGVLATGDRGKVMVLRRQANGNLAPIAVNVSAIYKGKAPDVTYLVPGDQVVVPGNRLKSFQKIMTFFPILSFARIFTGGLLP